MAGAAGDMNGLVTGEHRETAALKVGANQPGEHLQRLAVDRDKRFIQHPDGRAASDKPGERGTAILPL